MDGSEDSDCDDGSTDQQEQQQEQQRGSSVGTRGSEMSGVGQGGVPRGVSGGGASVTFSEGGGGFGASRGHAGESKSDSVREREPRRDPSRHRPCSRCRGGMSHACMADNSIALACREWCRSETEMCVGGGTHGTKKGGGGGGGAEGVRLVLSVQ